MKLSSWSHSNSRPKDAMDVRYIFENIESLCPDLEDDFFNEEHTYLLDRFQNDRHGLWISSFALRMMKIIKGTELHDSLTRLLRSPETISQLIIDMNGGNVPAEEQRVELEKLLSPILAVINESK